MTSRLKAKIIVLNILKYQTNLLLIVGAAYFPIIQLYSNNLNETKIQETYQIFIIISIVFLTLFYIFYKKTKNYNFTLYILFYINLISTFYGSISQYLEKYIGQTPLYREFQIIPGIILLLILILKKYNLNLYYFAKILIIIFYLTSLFKIVSHISISPKKNIIPIEFVNLKYNELTELPDIYYFILDEFASTKTINAFFEYNNNSFERELKTIGFDIFPNSYTDFSSTWPNLASILNMKKINPSTPPNELFQMILDNSVVNKLKNYGYKYIYISDQLINKGTFKNPFSDESLYEYQRNNKFNKNILNKFTSMYIKTSILKPFMSSKNINILRENELSKHNMLININKTEGKPIFVFLHSMITHVPFLFDEYGNNLDYSNQQNWNDKSIYLGNYKFSQSIILKDINSILSKNKNSIIIIQSDHGPRNEIYDNHWKYIFNAMYIPTITSGQEIENEFINISTFNYLFSKLKI